MNGVNILFVISAVFVPLLLISLNYSAISDFYEYSVPLNSLVLGPNFLADNTEEFQKIYNDEYSECFTTLHDNLFCYAKPREHGDILVSYVVGQNGIDGELHFDPINKGVSYFTMKNMTLISDDTAMITFADNNYRVGNKDMTTYEITDKFEFDIIVEKFDTFITKCNNYEGTSVTIVQYLGITTIDDADYFMTWHTTADSESGVSCDYPQIIKHSFGHDFGI